MRIFAPVYIIFISWVVSCQSQQHFFSKPIYRLPSDSLAEISRYSVKQLHYGVPLKGKATLVIVKERINKNTYVKTNKSKNSMNGVKMMFVQNIASMNWDNNDNIALYSDSNLNPLRISITSEEWCGNNYLEIRRKDNSYQMIGRPYTDDVGIVDKSKTINEKIYFYEQLPLLVRSIVTGDDNLTLRVMAQQTAYLKPHTDLLTLKLRRLKRETIILNGKTHKTVKISVNSIHRSKYWPQPEYYWLSLKGNFIVKAIRNFLGTQMGKFHITRVGYTLDDHQRFAYWGKNLSPATDGFDDRRRATLSSYAAINMSKWFSSNKKNGSFSFSRFIKKHKLPREYISSKRGNNKLVSSYNGKGGWYFDKEKQIFKPNVAEYK